MSEQRLVWQGGFRFAGTDSWGGTVQMDGEPGGAGAKPSDLLPLSLAACTAYDVVAILQKQRQDLRGLEAIIETEQDPDPPWRFRRITVRYRLTGEVDERKAKKAAALAEERYCSVAATLRPTVDLHVEVEVVPEPGVC